jgi:predicted alpha-1,2-mannosidase
MNRYLKTVCLALLAIAAGASAQSHYDSYKGLVMAGYQGWFNTPGDGADRGWHHYGNRQGFAPGNCSIDFWPDVSDYPIVYKTPFHFSNGTAACTFSSADSSTIDVHFDWMKTYGIDGVFMQRFVSEIKTQKGKRHFDRVLKHALSAARRHDRAISIMYDLSGMLPGDERLLLNDIDRLDAEYGLTSHHVPTWLHHNSRPLVAVWGVGFNDQRKYGLKEAGAIIDGLKARGYSVMAGVPTHWRTLDDDAVPDARLHEIIRKCDILLPWFVGRYDEARYEAFKPNIRKDMEWCAANGVDYVPLCYPGFSWRNKRGADSFYVDRNAGQFYQKQLSTAVEYGAEMLYIAMFDEMDEGTAIFKCARRNDAPDNRRIPFDGIDDHLPTDYYLRLTGEAGRMLRERMSAALGVPLSPVDYVNPFMGNISHLLVPTYPTIHLPNSMLRVYPEREDYTADQIRGLPVAVTSHRGSSAFSISPLSGQTPRRTPVESYTYDLEKIRPYRYSVYLDGEGVSVDYAPSHQSGVYNLRFEDDTLNRLIINTQHGELRMMGNGISGYQQIESSATRIYLYLEVEQAIREMRPREGNPQAMELLIAGRQVNLRYGISFIDEAQAKRNLEREIGTYSVDEVAAAGRRIWNETLGKIQVEGDNEDDKTVFYTSLYRVCERMINISEDGRYYSPFDHQVHPDEGIPFYTDDWIWDTYRAAHPLRVLIAPAMETDMIRSYLRMAQQTPEGWMPTFPEITGDSHRMNGNHAVAVVWDAYCKGLTDFDLEAAYTACKGAITEKSLLPWKRIPNTVLDVFYKENGYYPALKPNEQEYAKEVKENEKRQSVAITLGTSYDDWCLSQIARQLGRTDDYQYFLHRSYNYRNLYNPETAFFHPKDSAGRFIMPFDYRFAGGQGARDYYDENNGWTYRWDVQHNPADLIRIMGSPEVFADNLDQLFREPLGASRYRFYAQLPDQTGNVGQFSMANEPSLHIPYLYNYAGQPWKTQKRIRSLLTQWFRNDLMGVPGDEDGGGLSSFVVFSAMGFYPVTPGMPVYNIGSPLFPRIRIDLGNGKVFEIEAVNCSADNKYIQSATLNGKAWDRAWFSHADISNGGKLMLVMGDKANKNWGSKELPPAAEKID